MVLQGIYSFQKYAYHFYQNYTCTHLKGQIFLEIYTDRKTVASVPFCQLALQTNLYLVLLDHSFRQTFSILEQELAFMHHSLLLYHSMFMWVVCQITNHITIG